MATNTYHEVISVSDGEEEEEEEENDYDREEDEDDYYPDSFIEWFCAQEEHRFFCELDKSFVIDTFNLYGIKPLLEPHYDDALRTIIDHEDCESMMYDEMLSPAVIALYGLIHTRYIKTSQGMDAMCKKYLQGDFGVCPRTLCRKCKVLPTGLSDEFRHSPFKLYCPNCNDIYDCPPHLGFIDGAYFGPSFPPLFFMHFSNLLQHQSLEQYVPRVYGFKVHSSSVFHRKSRMQLLENNDHVNGKPNGSAAKKANDIEKKHDGNIGNSVMPDAKRCKREV